MKKRTRRLPAALTAFACSAMLICSSAVVSFAETAEEIPGTYRAEYDIMGMIGPQMEESGMKLEGELPIVFTMELKDDGAFTMEMEAEEFMETMQTIFKEQGPGLIRGMLEEQGVTEELFDQVKDQFGVESMDEFIENMTDELVQSLGDEMAGSFEEEFSVAGKYTVDGDKITFIAENTEAEAAASEADAEASSSSSSSAGGIFYEPETGTIEEDGSIKLVIPVDDDQFDIDTLELVFVKQ